MLTCMPNYKGLYRSKPLPKSNGKNRFMSLWQRYVQYNDKNLGVTTELTIDELKDLADLAYKASGDCHEVIFFDETFACPYKAEYYGADVVGFGGYSMVGENFFHDSMVNGVYNLYDVINQHFRAKLNCNRLFNRLEDAVSFYIVLNDLKTLSPNSVEQEEWHVVHIFKIL